MKYNKGFAPVLIVLIVLGALVVGGGAYYLGKNKVKDNKNVVENNTQNIDNKVTSEESTKAEKQIGYIKSIYSKDNTNYLTIDYVQWTHCDTDDCVASIKVINDNPLIRTFPISKDVQVNLQTYIDESSSSHYSLNQNLSLSKFKEALDYSLNHPLNPAHPPEVYYPKTILYWITIENGIITKIEEQFQA